MHNFINNHTGKEGQMRPQIIIIEGFLNEKKVRELIDELSRHQSVIMIWSSEGGQIRLFPQLAEAIQNIPKSLSVIAYAESMSAALAILAKEIKIVRKGHLHFHLGELNHFPVTMLDSNGKVPDHILKIFQNYQDRMFSRMEKLGWGTKTKLLSLFDQSGWLKFSAETLIESGHLVEDSAVIP